MRKGGTANVYALESDSEFDRLERQSTFAKYDYRAELELAGLPLEKAKHILDAGCGSGVVSRFLAAQYPASKVTGCDIGAARLELARKAAAHLRNLDFRLEDLAKLSFADRTFDAVLCRYVLQHVEKRHRLAAVREFHRCLAPGGRIALVDFDGSFFNIYPQTALMRKLLTAFERRGPVDLRIGRKLPALLLKAGFKDLRWRIETVECQGRDLECEREMVSEKLLSAMPLVATFLGSVALAEKFRREYLETMSAPELVLFYNKFIVTAAKPAERHLRLVRG